MLDLEVEPVQGIPHQPVHTHRAFVTDVNELMVAQDSQEGSTRERTLDVVRRVRTDRERDVHVTDGRDGRRRWRRGDGTKVPSL